MTQHLTFESVTGGHPEKAANQAANRILDEILSQDPQAHVACEVTRATNQAHLFGTVRALARVDYASVARKIRYC